MRTWPIHLIIFPLLKFSHSYSSRQVFYSSIPIWDCLHLFPSRNQLHKIPATLHYRWFESGERQTGVSANNGLLPSNLGFHFLNSNVSHLDTTFMIARNWVVLSILYWLFEIAVVHVGSLNKVLILFFEDPCNYWITRPSWTYGCSCRDSGSQ